MEIKNTCVFVLGLAAFGCASDAGESTSEVGEVAQALNPKHLSYEQIDITIGPPEYDFWAPTGLSDAGDVFGAGFDCTDDFSFCSFDLLKLDEDGVFSLVLQDFSPSEVNGPGDVGGCVLDDEAGTAQAAVFRSNGALELLPRPEGELSSCIVQLSDAEVAVVSSVDENLVFSQYVARNHQTYALPGDIQVTDVNDHGVVAGILVTDAGERAVRFDSRRQASTLLEPVAPDPHSWGLGINRAGEVLGYSFEFGATERIGKWTTTNQFKVSFVEGTPEFPTVSNVLIWNEDGFIVVSNAPTDEKTYVIPKPGVRLDLAGLVGDAVVPSTLLAFDVNAHADFIATSLVDGTSQLYRRCH
jgi:hypothetical protein